MIFHSYVSLPKGKLGCEQRLPRQPARRGQQKLLYNDQGLRRSMGLMCGSWKNDAFGTFIIYNYTTTLIHILYITIYIYVYICVYIYICIYCIRVYPCINLSGSPNNHHEKATSMESSFFSASARTGEEFQLSECSEDSEKADLSSESPCFWCVNSKQKSFRSSSLYTY